MAHESMKKSKIKVGQCYDFIDRVFIVVDGPHFKNPICWSVQNTVTKEIFIWEEKGILTLRRPFQNFG